MLVEIDMLPVGGETKSGDAIVIRYGDLSEYEIMVVDGGDLDAGKRVVDHIKAVYGDDAKVKHVVCTHSDGDHASGLRPVLEQLPCENLWVHQPWKHVATLNPKFKGNWTDENLAKHLREDCFPIIAELCDIADEEGVTPLEPLAGADIGPFRVLAPSIDRWLDLVPQMDQTPSEKVVSLLEKATRAIAAAAASVFSVFESWDIETLSDPGENATSIPNETSVILFGAFGDNGDKILLTGDAGVGALADALASAAALGLDITGPKLFQMPHHGSRRNIGPTMLDAIAGEKLSDEQNKRGWAVASVAEKCAKRPYRSVTNAFSRRGYNTTSTKGITVNYRVGYPMRGGLSSIAPDPFHYMVEE